MPRLRALRAQPPLRRLPHVPPGQAAHLDRARARRAHQSARLRELLVELRARVCQLIQLKREFATHLPELAVELRGALLGRRARRIRLGAGAFDLRQARVLAGEQLLRLAQLGRRRLLSAGRRPGLGVGRGWWGFGGARCQRRHDPGVGPGLVRVAGSRVSRGVEHRQLGGALRVGLGVS